MRWKVLTLTQPWAILVALGAKKIETRSWRTSYRGPLAIHAAQGLGPVGGRRGLRALVGSEPFYTALVDTVQHTPQKSLIDAIVDSLPLGAIVATCRLIDCVSTDTTFLGWKRWQYPGTEHSIRWEMTEQERAFGDYSVGRYAWLLADVQALPEPIPCKGALGLWEYDDKVPV